jgi:SAM-dependent methyltransferase
VRWIAGVPAGSRALDVACGGGRHTRLLLQQGLRVEAVDRDLNEISQWATSPHVHLREADLEAGPWPYAPECFDAVVVTNYLHRPLFPHLIDALKPSGVLIYETFAAGNERFGRPTNPDFLLRPGELLEAVRGRLRVIAYEDLRVDVPKPAMVQRICAQRG